MAKRVHGPQPPRRSRDRSTDRLAVRERFLIVCEGEKTEPNYFRGFEKDGRILVIEGTGRNTLTLVEEAIRLRKEKAAELQRQRKEPFDQCWCVFDRDSFPSGNFNSAIDKAKAQGFRVAYSNVCFELWYLLHFDYHQSAITREEYRDKLNDLLGQRYVKNSKTMYALLLGQQEAAIRHAKALQRFYRTDNPEQNNPSTTVFELVEELNKSVGFRTITKDNENDQ